MTSASTTKPLWSVCIPNYNYERYLGRTLESALAAGSAASVDFEVVISDNASTDGSVALVRAMQDGRVRVVVNACNVGFSGNLDKAARMARGERMLMLSSDDLVRVRAFDVYRAIEARIDPATRAVLTATMDQIDPADAITGRIGPDPELWHDTDVDAQLSAAIGARVFRVDARELLRRSLASMKNPFNFAATLYRREDYERIEGYGGGRMINPDKWFHWRLLGVTETAIYVDEPLFAYRWHPNNQTAQQAAQGALKFLVDEYASTLELDDALLRRAGLQRSDVEAAFVERDIVRHGLATLAKGDRKKARRIFDFGKAVYPHRVRENRRSAALAALLAGDVVGQRIASAAYQWWGRG